MLGIKSPIGITLGVSDTTQVTFSGDKKQAFTQSRNPDFTDDVQEIFAHNRSNLQV